jgi:hypothetical protein
MELRIRMNKKILLLLSLIILIFFAVVFFFYFQSRNLESRLSAHCDEEVVGEEFVRRCNVFLSDYYINEKGQACLSITLPVVNPSERDILQCFSQDIVEWNNPYDDYSMKIPVTLDFFYSKDLDFSKLFSRRSPSMLRVGVMDNDLAYEIVGPINDILVKKGERMISYMTPQLFENLRRGYHINVIRKRSQTEANLFSVVTVTKARIDSILTEGDDVVFSFTFYVGESKIKRDIRTSEFGVGFPTGEENVIEMKYFDSNSDISFLLEDVDDSYFVVDLKFLGHEEIDSLDIEMVDKYMLEGGSAEVEMENIYFE